MAILEQGDKAPDFTLETDSGTSFTLSAHKGHPVVLFFYPQDDTQSCTIENMEFTALADAFAAIKAQVVGISPDSTKAHGKFRDKYKLGTTLAADPDHIAINAFGVWGEKTTFGKTYMGLIRSTFLIGPDGRIARQWTVRRVKGHAAEVLEATKALIA